MKKKLLIFTFALLLMISATGCGGKTFTQGNMSFKLEGDWTVEDVSELEKTYFNGDNGLVSVEVHNKDTVSYLGSTLSEAMKQDIKNTYESEKVMPNVSEEEITVDGVKATLLIYTIKEKSPPGADMEKLIFIKGDTYYRLYFFGDLDKEFVKKFADTIRFN